MWAANAPVGRVPYHLDPEAMLMMPCMGTAAGVAGIHGAGLHGRDSATAQATTPGGASRACTLAAVTLMANSQPKVSITRLRLRPLTFLPASSPCSPPWASRA